MLDSIFVKSISYFDRNIMCQFLDNITISGSGQIPVTFLEGTKLTCRRLQSKGCGFLCCFVV